MPRTADDKTDLGSSLINGLLLKAYWAFFSLFAVQIAVMKLCNGGFLDTPYAHIFPLNGREPRILGGTLQEFSFPSKDGVERCRLAPGVVPTELRATSPGAREGFQRSLQGALAASLPEFCHSTMRSRDCDSACATAPGTQPQRTAPAWHHPALKPGSRCRRPECRWGACVFGTPSN